MNTKIKPANSVYTAVNQFVAEVTEAARLSSPDRVMRVVERWWRMYYPASRSIPPGEHRLSDIVTMLRYQITHIEYERKGERYHQKPSETSVHNYRVSQTLLTDPERARREMGEMLFACEDVSCLGTVTIQSSTLLQQRSGAMGEKKVVTKKVVAKKSGAVSAAKTAAKAQKEKVVEKKKPGLVGFIIDMMLARDKSWDEMHALGRKNYPERDDAYMSKALSFVKSKLNTGAYPNKFDPSKEKPIVRLERVSGKLQEKVTGSSEPKAKSSKATPKPKAAKKEIPEIAKKLVLGKKKPTPPAPIAKRPLPKKPVVAVTEAAFTEPA